MSDKCCVKILGSVHIAFIYTSHNIQEVNLRNGRKDWEVASAEVVFTVTTFIGFTNGSL